MSSYIHRKTNKYQKNSNKKINSPRNKTQKIFNSEDYSSNDGMMVTVWGPPTWHMLHTISFNYPVNPTKKDKEEYRNFIISLKYILPCGKCRKNLIKNMKKLQLTMKSMKSRDTFSKYIYDLHEIVNHMTGKTSGLSYDDIRERYEHFRARCTHPINELHIDKNIIKPETGCVVPLYGEKSKCILHIIPQSKKCDSFNIDKNCIKQKLFPDK
jgi:hypothetical protein